MSREVSVPTRDLESALAYLEGLSVILQTLDTERRGREATDPLVEELQTLENALYEWSPLPHQRSSGQGWAIVDHNLTDLRQRLTRLRAGADAENSS
ncbi:MAG: hypothetical protein H0T40_04145 [Geodermatophilaceae bacterium]|nr:hypothetical protein [Geodermatophilaceae bacterium]